MSLRSRAREIVLQILYQDDLNKERSTDEDLPFIKNRLHNNGNIVEFAKELLDGVRNRMDDIDSQLSKVAENWRISRMAATDRNVLRLGAFEILYFDTPAKVAVNEAIELAKRYGNELSPNFINGILDRLIKQETSPPESGDHQETDSLESGPQEMDAEIPEAAETEVASEGSESPKLEEPEVDPSSPGLDAPSVASDL